MVAKEKSGAARLQRKRKRKFFIIEAGWAVFPYEHVNHQAFVGTDLFVKWPDERGFGQYPELPTFLLTGKDQRDYWQYCSYWFVSERMKAFLEEFDPAAFAFLKCETKLKDGSVGPPQWLCDVIRVRDALVENKSPGMDVKYDTTGKKYYLIRAHGVLTFDEDVVGPHHVFHLRHSLDYTVCDEDFKRAYKEAGLKGMTFYLGKIPSWETKAEKARRAARDEAYLRSIGQRKD
jgi:hypothetical protein